MISLLLDDPILLLLTLPVLLLSLTLHEVSHGYAAFKCGDTTARDLGRLTLNPFKHLDLFGTISMLFIGFGWAKPVPVNFRGLKKPRRDIAIVSAAGPLANILLCLLSVVLYFVCLVIMTVPDSNLPLAEFAKEVERAYGTSIMFYDQSVLFGEFMLNNFGFSLSSVQCAILNMFSISASLNAGLAMFNLIPFPPLDGSKILACLLPQRLGAKYLMLEKYVRYVVVGICLLSLLGDYVPALSSVSDIILTPVSFLREGIINLFESLMYLILGVR